jgi:methionine sulfoxide reductase catalytic subunit
VTFGLIEHSSLKENDEIMKPIRSSEITPEHVYLTRRDFLKSMGIISASAMVLAACRGRETPGRTSRTSNSGGNTPVSGSGVDELGDPLTPFEDVTNYNNFYEFTTDKTKVAQLSKDFRASPWEVQVSGLVKNPKTYSVDDLKKFSIQERVYRLRCVEAWSMVIPWIGFPLAELLNEVEPTSEAKYVRFETLYDLDQLPGQKSKWFPWPYVEGLRLDEAMHNLTILSTGLYGRDLLPQNGAPVRLVVPWKYGFKSSKSIVKIDLVAKMPISLWMSVAPKMYGFYSNVIPNVDHPRWSQATERRIGELERRETLMFNGYEEEVSHLYTGQDLNVDFFIRGK